MSSEAHSAQAAPSDQSTDAPERVPTEMEKDIAAEHKETNAASTAPERVPAEQEKNAGIEASKQNDDLPVYDELDKTITVDTLHNDEGVRVLANYHGDTEWTAEEEKRLTKKIDRRLLSIVVTTYGLQYYDKAMLGQAALFGLVEDLSLDIGDRYSFSSAIFYLG